MPLLAEDDPDTLQACWEALAAVAGSIPKEMQPSFVRCLKVGGGSPAVGAASRWGRGPGRGTHEMAGSSWGSARTGMASGGRRWAAEP